MAKDITRATRVASAASGTAAIAGAHNVCHSLCTGAIALVALFGITATGMPLAWMTDWAPAFWAMAVTGLATTLAIGMRNSCLSWPGLLVNTGIVVAGVPFWPGLTTAFWLVGGAILAAGIGLWVRNKWFM